MGEDLMLRPPPPPRGITSIVTSGYAPERLSTSDVFDPCKVGTAGPPQGLLFSRSSDILGCALSVSNPPLSGLRRCWSGPASSRTPHLQR